MRAYRCYFVDGNDRIVDVAIVECRDDDEVRKRALDLLAARARLPAIEVWDRERYVLHHSRPSRACIPWEGRPIAAAPARPPWPQRPPAGAW